ncbi:MAG: flavodoxin family protein [Syntrophales bacterium]|nr:flavodoxin family protein [Syntrophales bacterium]
MNALVTYYSQTGNTEKLARAIHEAISIAKEIKPVQDLESADGYDLIFCGFPVQAHSVPGKVQSFIKGLPKGQKVAFFFTHGSLSGGQLPKQAFEHAIGLAPTATILGHFGCRGSVDQKIIDALMQKPEHRAWAQEAQSAEGHPDRGDFDDAETFALEMIAKIGS